MASKVFVFLLGGHYSSAKAPTRRETEPRRRFPWDGPRRFAKGICRDRWSIAGHGVVIQEPIIVKTELLLEVQPMKPNARRDRPLRRAVRRRGDRALGLFFEALEVRWLLSTMDWTNTSGGPWNVAANWVNAANPSDHHVPNTTDNAVINVPGNVTVTYQGSQPTVLTLQNNDTIWVNGSNAGGNATLSVSQSITNDGTILLQSSNAGYSDAISTGSGTLTNDPDGTIQVTNGSGGPRTITGTLVNQGQIEVDGASYLTITGRTTRPAGRSAGLATSSTAPSM